MRNAIALLLSLTPGLLAQRVTEQEPNDVVGTAQALVFGQQVDCNLLANEQDWFTFTMTGTGEVHVQTSGNFAVNPSVDTCVLLYDATGTTRLAWNDQARGSHSDLGVTLSAGNYSVLVVGKTNTVAGAYSLDLVSYPATVINTVEAAEPNNHPGSGGIPTPINLNDTFAGSLSAPADEDWFTFTLTLPAVVQAHVYDDSTVPQLDSALIALHKDMGAGSWSQIGSSTQTGGHRALTLGHVSYLTPGNYAFSITSGTVATGIAPLDYVKIGNYAVRTRMMTLPSYQIVPEAIEPNNDINTFAYLNVGDDATGFCSGQNEEDWWGLIVTAPTTLVLITEDGVTPAITDTTVKLYGSTGAVLGQASSGGAASHGKLVHTITTPGLYFVAVQGGLFAATGNYVLRTGGGTPIALPVGFQQSPPSTNACVGSNTLRPQLKTAASEVPQLGTHFTMRVNNALPNAGIVSALGFSNTMATPNIPLPLDLGPFGAPTCFLRVDPAQTNFGIADGTGIWFWDLPIPNDLYLNGLVVWVQVACFDAPLNAFGISVSNECKMTLGNRGY